MRDGDALDFEQIDLEETLLVGDQFDPLDGTRGPFGRDAEVPGRLLRSSIRVIAKLGEEACYGIGARQVLNILGRQFTIELHRGPLSARLGRELPVYPCERGVEAHG